MQANVALDISAESNTNSAVVQIDKPVGAVVDVSCLFSGYPVVLHVRFSPDSSIAHIDERPAELSNFEWFARLCANVGHKYQARAGGRGFFRLSRVELEALKVLPAN